MKIQPWTFWIEGAAVVSGLLYTLLLIAHNPICWPFAIISSGLFIGLCFGRKIYAETLLHLFYLGMAIYGWMVFNQPQTRESWDLNWWQHLVFIAGLSAITYALGKLLQKRTDAALPFLDSFTTVFSMGATMLMVNLILENWLYFIVINLFAIRLYASRGLWLAAVLMGIYAIMAVYGYFSWMP
jgi:nicotinamide mononucleotide transporter